MHDLFFIIQENVVHCYIVNMISHEVREFSLHFYLCSFIVLAFSMHDDLA